MWPLVRGSRLSKLLTAAALSAGAPVALAQSGSAADPAPPAPAPATPAPTTPAPATPAPATSAPTTPAPATTPAAAPPTVRPSAEPAIGDDPRDLFGLRRKAPEARGCAAPDHLPTECALEQDPLAEASLGVIGTYLPAAALARLPTADLLHDSQAAFALGVGRDDGGVFIGGASSLENRWTIEGAPVDSVRNTSAETRLPLAFLAGLRVTTGGFAARDLTASGGVIDAELIRGGTRHTASAQAWLGVMGRREPTPIPPGTYSPLRGAITEPRTTTVSAVAAGPLTRTLGGRLWYAAGIAPTASLADFEQTGVRLVDRNSDGEPDVRSDGSLAIETISRDSRDATAFQVPMMARVGLERTGERLDLTLLASWATSPRFTIVATPEASAVARDTLLLDGIASWRRRWRDTSVRLQLAWHRSARKERAASSAGEAPQLQTAFVPPQSELSGLDPRFGAGCRDGAPDDRYPALTNCPVPTGWFARRGVGQLVDVTGDRPSFQLELARRAGRHVVRGGVHGEDARLLVDTRFSGGVLERSLFAGHSDTTQHLDPRGANLEDCKLNFDVPCPVLPRTELEYLTRHVAVFVQDRWQPRPDLVLEAGVRWELQQLSGQLRFDGNFAPRAAVAWAPLGAGRSRVAATFGRLYGYLPAGLGERIDAAPSLVTEVTSSAGSTRIINLGTVSRARADTGAMTTDELTLSAELAWPGLGQLVLRTQHRWLRAGLEDDLRGFGNPENATRRVDVLGVELASAPGAGLAVRAGYAWGQAVGSLVGAYDPRRGVLQYTSRDFDELTANLAGALPSSLGHRLYTEVASQRRVGPLTLEGGVRLALASGRPRNVLGDNNLLGQVYLLPRGSAGRLPPQLTTDLRLAGRWSRFSLILLVQNLFARQVVTSDNEIYARDLLLPIDGGDASDLPFLKDLLGDPAARAPAYRSPSAYQPPITGFLGLEATL